MLPIIKLEFHRAFRNRYFMLAVIIGCFISITHMIQFVIPKTAFLDSYKVDLEYPFSLFNTWIGGENTSLQSILYFFMLPIIGTIPFAESLNFDLTTSYAGQIIVRSKKSRYLTAKFIATWFSAGAAITIPLLFDLLGTALFIPALIPESSSLTFGIFEISMWSSLFYSHPFLYVAGYLVIIFLLGGVFCCSALTVSLFTSNKFTVLLSPFLLYIFLYFVIGLMYDPSFNPINILHPSQITPMDMFYICSEFMILTFLIGGIYYIRGIKYEIV